jgi:hypothetical protein
MEAGGGVQVVSVLKVAIYVLELLFAVGLIGSAIVITLTAIEDSVVVFTRTEGPEVDEPEGKDVHAQALVSSHPGVQAS